MPRMMKPFTPLLLVIASLVILLFACSKFGDSFPPPPPDPCSLVAVGISGSVTNPSAASLSDGTITATATGGNGFTYSLNGGGFQGSGKFTGLPAGNYTVMTKNSDGCSASLSFVLVNPTPLCSGVNITGTFVTTTNVPCEPNSATITVTVAGGEPPYYYSLDGGSFQTSRIFTNVSSGSHAITIRDVNGCMGSASTSVNSLPSGYLFAEVKSIIQYYCMSCHNTASPAGGVDYSVSCNIVSGKDRIRARAVDGNPSPMPVTGLIPAYERQKIINWLNAGGRYTD